MIKQKSNAVSDFPESKITLPRPGLRMSGRLRESIEVIVLITAIYTLFNMLTVRFVVDGPSMQPNFETGQFLIVSRLNYMLGTPERGDIAVFHFPGDTRNDYIKRIIGLPGDTVEFRETQVFVNGQPIEEPYINETCGNHLCPDNKWSLGPAEYFFMGDNRNHSSDSRSFGPVHEEYIVGEVLIRYWPLSDIALVSRIGYPD